MGTERGAVRELGAWSAYGMKGRVSTRIWPTMSWPFGSPQTCRLTLRCLCWKSCLRVYVCHGWVGGYLFKWLMGEEILELLLPHRDPVSLPPLLWTLCLRSPGSWV